MSVPHVASGEVINLEEQLDGLETHHSRALVKGEHFEAMLVQLNENRTMELDPVDGPVTIQCLRGFARLENEHEARAVGPGDWVFVEGDIWRQVLAESDCSLLVTVLFTR